jgi:phage tail sheath protein FI
MANLSPGVDVVERDVSLTIPSVTSSVGAIVVAAEKGALNVATLITNQSDYVNQFGKPDDVNYPHWFTANAFLSQSNQLYVVRTEDSRTLCAGVTIGISANGSEEQSLSWPTPKPAEYFPMDYSYIGLDANGNQNPEGAEAVSGATPVFGSSGEEIFHIYGRGAGPYYNKVSVTVINAIDFAQLKNMKEELAQAVLKSEIVEIAQKYYTGTPATTATPDTGDYLSKSLIKYDIIDPANWSVDTQLLDEYLAFEYGPELGYPTDETDTLNDQFAIIVYDPTGQVAERYIASKNKDAVDSLGNGIFAPKLINGLAGVGGSQYIYFFVGKSETGASGARIISTGKVNLQGAEELVGFRPKKDENGNYIPGTTSSLLDLTGEIEAQWRDKFTNKETLQVDLLLDPDYTDDLKRTLDDIAQNVRKDCFVFLNMPIGYLINTITGRAFADTYTQQKNYVQNSLLINSSYSSMYGQYFKVYDNYAEKDRWVPVTGYVAARCAATDFSDAQWVPFAGLNRGIVDNVKGVAINPNKGQRDVLYSNRINPIANFTGDGITIFGQKTMQAKPSSFDRINVRRLFLYLEKSIEKMSRYMLFELNDDFTRSRFRGIVNPFLQEVKNRRGVTDFLVVCDSSNNSATDIDNNQLNAEILVKPTRVAEFIKLTFTSVSTGVSFEEVVIKS